MTEETVNPTAERPADQGEGPEVAVADDTTQPVDEAHETAPSTASVVMDEPVSDTTGVPAALATAPEAGGTEPETETAPASTAAVAQEAPAPVSAAAASAPAAPSSSGSSGSSGGGSSRATTTTMADAFPSFAAEAGDDYSSTFTSLKEGDVVQGVVVHIDRGEVLVDVGTKSEGIIRRHELSRDPSLSAEDIVKVGEKIDVYVMETENQDGNLILSKKRADFEKAWERVQEAREQNKTLTAMVTDRVKGGLVVDLGIRGFVPASHVGNGSMKNNLEKYVGQSIPLKVIEVDKERRKVVLSNKLAQDEDRQSRKAETVSSLAPGQIRHGIVRRLTNYGAFIDLGGIDGLLHISEMSWTRINHPQEVLREGQELDVKILKMDLDAGRVSLGLRDILPDPWSGLDQRYHPGDVITGTVTRVVPFGVFVQVEGGIEGIIPNSELGSRKGKAGQLAQGQEVEVRVLDVRPEERKMSLSVRGLQGDEEPAGYVETPERGARPERGERPERPERGGRRERREVEEYSPREEPRFTIGDALRAKEEAEAESEAEEE